MKISGYRSSIPARNIGFLSMLSPEGACQGSHNTARVGAYHSSIGTCNLTPGKSYFPGIARSRLIVDSAALRQSSSMLDNNAIAGPTRLCNGGWFVHWLTFHLATSRQPKPIFYIAEPAGSIWALLQAIAQSRADHAGDRSGLRLSAIRFRLKPGLQRAKRDLSILRQRRDELNRLAADGKGDDQPPRDRSARPAANHTTQP